ncbi:plasmid mobilization protein [Actinomadura gamaensis]|uniref:Mobilization protein MobC n=1 Tax=Actinomadura gamaensis TaxID=1763541 RepID=A0ABV9TUN9_9ACTN
MEIPGISLPTERGREHEPDRARSGMEVALPQERLPQQAPKRRHGTDQNRRRHQSPRRDKKITFSLSRQEYAVLRDAARRSHLAVGAFVAHAALAEATGAGRADHAELRALLGELMQAGGQVRRLGVNLNQAVAALHSGELAQQLGAYAHACARAVDKLDRTADEICRRLP